MNARIVGIVLVKNENLYVERVIRNILGFCDEVIVTDHESNDGTTEILHALAAECPKVKFHRIKYPAESHALLQPYVNTSTWVFGVDGDELYDAEGLAKFRETVLGGSLERWWMILGNVLNSDAWNVDSQRAWGYLSPPCRSMTKLYNFSAITEWRGETPSRLHGGKIVFKPGYESEPKYDLNREFDWESSPFRCLHLCFVPRSSKATSDETHRHHPEVIGRNFWQELRQKLWRALRPKASLDWRQERYRRGARVEKEVKGF